MKPALPRPTSYESHPFVTSFRAQGNEMYPINDIWDSNGQRTGYALEVTPGMLLPNLKNYLVKSATLQSVMNGQLAIIAIPFEALKDEYKPVLAQAPAPTPPSGLARRLLKHLTR